MWLQQKKKVRASPRSGVGSGIVACLDLAALRAFLPRIEHQMRPRAVEGPQRQSFQILPPPNYLGLAPPRADFWESSENGDRISPLGCLPLTLAATQEQYDSILATQVTLRDLHMLHQFDETEVDRIIHQLQSLQRVSAQFHLVRLLIDGLLHSQVVIHRGLATGFIIPDTPVEFWGLAASFSGNHTLDIFLSRRSPNDTATVLHVWLAHHGVSRVHRFEEELRLEIACGLVEHHASLPSSIRTAIDCATPSETLLYLEQLQVANPKHRFRRAI